MSLDNRSGEVNKNGIQADIDAELLFHIDNRIAELVGSGLSPENARTTAIAEFGDLDATRKYCTEMDRKRHRTGRLRQRVAGFGQDVAFGMRQLRRRPAFTALVVGTLALGIGAASALFSVANAVLLKPLPYATPERLVRVHGSHDGQDRNISPLDFLDWQADLETFAGIAAVTSDQQFFQGDGPPILLKGAAVSHSLLGVLGVTPSMGRDFAATDDAPGADPVVLLAHETWVSGFGGDSSVVGTAVNLNAVPRTVIGILPRGFMYPDPSRRPSVDYLLPVAIDPERNGRGGHWLQVVARMRDETALDAAQAEVSLVSERLAAAYPATNTGWSARVVPLKDEIVGDHRQILLLLATSVVAILVIASLNVANLVLARGTKEAGEVAVRAAIGASRARILRQLAVENLLLATMAGGLAVLVAAVSLDAIVALAPGGVPRLENAGVDAGMLVFAALVALATTLVFALGPAARTSQQDFQTVLRSSGNAVSASRRLLRSQAGLVVVQIALATAVLNSAGLLGRSFWKLTTVDPGLATDGVVTTTILVQPNVAERADGVGRFYAALAQGVESAPGVLAVGAVQIAPLTGGYSCNGFALDDRPDFDEGADICAEERVATPGYFAAAGIPLLQGEVFSPRHTADAESVVLVNNAFAERFFGGQNPVGRSFTWGNREEANWRRIIGVVGDVHHFSLRQDSPPEVYLPHSQYPYYREMTLFVRSELGIDEVVRTVRSEVDRLSPGVPVYDVRTLSDAVSGSLALDRFRLMLVGIFATAALALALAGVFGVTSYAVGVRTRELGIRMALGATRAATIRAVVAREIGLAVTGVVAGFVITLLVRGVLTGMVFGISTIDPLVLAAVATGVMVASVLGALAPALEAGRVDPLTAVRAE